ncbi:hypothetical protein EFY79_12945, partial [Hanamia caeni]
MRKFYVLIFIVLGFTANSNGQATLSSNTIADFGNVCVGTVAGPNPFTISGTNLTSANITVGPLNGFTFSTTSGGTYTPSLSLNQSGGTYSQSIYVKFSPISGQSYNGLIPISGGGASTINVSVTGTGLATQPVSVSIVSDAPGNTICAGTSVTFTATPINEGASPVYQWQVGGVNVGLNSGTYTTSTLTDGKDVKVILTSNTACATGNPATSNIVVMKVNPMPTATATNSSQTICSGNAITTMAISGNVAGATYNWTRDNTTGVTGIAGSGSGNISGTLTNTTNAPITVTFTITPTANGCPGTPITATVLVNPTPTATANNYSQTICSGSAINTMVISGNVAGATYNWTRDNTTGVTGIAGSGSGNISGILTNTTNAPITVTFTITPTANSCPGEAITATVLVNPTPTATATNSSQTICSGSAITTMAMSGSVAGTTYSWTRNNTAGVTGIAGSGSGNISGTLTNTTNAPVTVTFTITPTANGCPGTPITATVLVNPTPTATATNSSQTICSGSAINTMVISGNVAGATYNWTRDNTTGVTGIAGSGSGNISGILTNTTNAPITVTFTITPTANSCPGEAITATVLVNPTPTATATNSSQTICSGSAINTMVISGNVAGATYNWTRNNTVGVTGVVGSGSGNISGTLTNTTNAPITVTFTITPTANGCPGTPITATVLVNPNASISLTSATSTTSQSVCRLSAINNITYNVVGATTFNVNGLPPGVSANLSAGVLTISGTPNITISSTTSYNYIINTIGSCTNASASGTIKVFVGSPGGWNGKSITISPSTSICPPATITLSVPAATNAQYYDWQLPSGWVISSGDSTNSVTVNVTPGAAIGNQVVTVLAKNSCGSISLLSPSNGKNAFNVNSFNGVTVSPTSQSVCSDGSISVAATLTGNANSGTWSAPFGGFSNITQSGSIVSATYTPATVPAITNGNVTLTITTNTPTGNGCPNVAGTATVAVTINQPSSAPTSLSSPTTICNGSSTTLTQTGGVLGTGAVWKWYTNSTYTTLAPGTVAANGSLTVSPATTTTYYLRAETATNGPCSQYVAGGNVTITVSQPSVAPTSLSADVTICNGSSTTLTQTGGVLGTGATWKWYTDAGYNTLAPGTVAANGSLSVSPTATTTYYLRAESSTGTPCATEVAATGSVTVTVNQPSAAPTSLSSPVTICSGSSTTLTQTGGVLGTGAVWKWYTNSTYT